MNSKRTQKKLMKEFSKAAGGFCSRADKPPVGIAFVFECFFYAATVLLVALTVRRFMFEPTIVDGESMQTTLMDGERIFIDKFSYCVTEPGRGDVVIVHYPGRSEHFVKRIVALEGETIEIRNGYVYIDGERLDESAYASDEWYGRIRLLINSPQSHDGVYTVPQGHVFVMGDNRNWSKDSRSREVGAIPVTEILGRARFVFWPLEGLRSIGS